MKNNTKKFQIIKAAQKRFARHGLAKTSVEEIARDLRIAKATIYHYFESKESIYYEVLNSEVEKYIMELTEIFDTQELDFSTKISTFIDTKIRLKEKYSLIYEVFINLQRENPLEQDEKILKNLIDQEYSIISGFLKKAFNKKIEPSITEFVVFQTWGAAIASKFNEILNKTDLKKNREFFIKFFEKGLT